MALYRWYTEPLIHITDTIYRTKCLNTSFDIDLSKKNHSSIPKHHYPHENSHIFIETYGNMYIILHNYIGHNILHIIRNNNLQNIEGPLTYDNIYNGGHEQVEDICYIYHDTIYLLNYYISDSFSSICYGHTNINNLVKIYINHNNPFWLDNIDRIVLDANKTQIKSLRNTRLAYLGFFEGTLFAIFFFENEEIISIDQSRNIYYNIEIHNKFLELRPSLNNDNTYFTKFSNYIKEELPVAMPHLSCTFDGSLTRLKKEHVIKLHPYTKKNITIMMLKRLRDRKSGLQIIPIPVLFMIWSFAFL